MDLNKCLYAIKAFSSISLVDYNFSHTQESMEDLYHNLPFLLVATGAAGCIEGGKGGSYASSLEAGSWDTSSV